MSEPAGWGEWVEAVEDFALSSPGPARFAARQRLNAFVRELLEDRERLLKVAKAGVVGLVSDLTYSDRRDLADHMRVEIDRIDAARRADTTPREG